MDVLTSKSYKDYSYTSRYSTVPYYYNTVDKKYVYGLSSQLKNTTNYVLHTVAEDDTLDTLALKYYGRPDFFWVIADFNRIQDPFEDIFEKFNYIRIPSISSIRWQ